VAKGGFAGFGSGFGGKVLGVLQPQQFLLLNLHAAHGGILGQAANVEIGTLADGGRLKASSRVCNSKNPQIMVFYDVFNSMFMALGLGLGTLRARLPRCPW
jgi:hypothetical protein